MASFVCPRCGAPTPVRIADGGACASCLSADAWSRWARAGVLVIDRAAIAAVEARERTAAAQRVRGLVAALLASSVALGLAVLSVVFVARAFGPRPVGAPAALAEGLRDSMHRVLVVGLAAFGAGLASLWLASARRGQLPSAPRSFAGLALRAASLLGAVAGGAAVLAAGVGNWLFEPLRGFEHGSMPARLRLDISPAAGRATDATAVIVAPDEHGDALRGAVGTGAVVAVGAGRALVLTCSHVAMPYAAVGTVKNPASAQPVWVQLADGRSAGGRVVWTARPPLDIALVEVKVDDPPAPVPIASATDGIDADEAVFFVPNPYRRSFRVERGKVLRREVHDTPAGRYSLLFTDLPVEHGDSGSGLFDVHGRLIGLNTWQTLGPTSPQGISLPAEAMAEVAHQADELHGSASKSVLAPPEAPP
jgi:S1-C subfamily serine protease